MQTVKVFAELINAKNHAIMEGTKVGPDAMKNWIAEIKKVGRAEGERQSRAGEAARDIVVVPRHVSACFELLEFHAAFDLQLQKNPPLMKQTQELSSSKMLVRLCQKPLETSCRLTL